MAEVKKMENFIQQLQEFQKEELPALMITLRILQKALFFQGPKQANKRILIFMLMNPMKMKMDMI